MLECHSCYNCHIVTIQNSLTVLKQDSFFEIAKVINLILVYCDVCCESSLEKKQTNVMRQLCHLYAVNYAVLYGST